VLVEVATAIRVRGGVRFDTRNGLVERHYRRQSAVVLLAPPVVRSIFCMHFLTLAAVPEAAV